MSEGVVAPRPSMSRSSCQNLQLLHLKAFLQSTLQHGQKHQQQDQEHSKHSNTFLSNASGSNPFVHTSIDLIAVHKP